VPTSGQPSRLLHRTASRTVRVREASAALQVHPVADAQALSVTMDSHSTRSSRNGFAAQGIDRAHAQRRDPTWVAANLSDPKTRFVPLWRSRNLVAGSPFRAVFLSHEQVADLLPEATSVTLLGREEGRVYFGLGLPGREPTPPQELSRLGEFRDLREVAPLLSPLEGALLAHARALVYWHRRHRFCGDCGHPTEGAEAGHVRLCTNASCGRQHFPRTDPAIIVLVTSGERCLLGRQPSWPSGRYSTIAGFVEPGESLEAAVMREVREETGVFVREVHYQSSQPWPFPASLMLGFRAVAAGEEIHLGDDELEDARWFSRAELERGMKEGTFRLPGRISIAYRLIEDWFDEGSPGRLARIDKLPW
jgi:NAD+ diphosphatase